MSQSLQTGEAPRRFALALPVVRPTIHRLLAVFILLASLYSVVNPPFEAPDEIWHFAFVQHLATQRTLPIAEPNTQALWRQQGTQAPAYYAAAALLTAPFDQSDFPQIFDRANPHRAIGQPGTAINRNYLVHHQQDERFPWKQSILALHVARLFFRLPWRGHRLCRLPCAASFSPTTGCFARRGLCCPSTPICFHQRLRQQRQRGQRRGRARSMATDGTVGRWRAAATRPSSEARLYARPCAAFQAERARPRRCVGGGNSVAGLATSQPSSCC